jgi:asparagine synthase (glutamine-hydrolysing)
MGASLEARCPFLDLDVMNMAMRIPEKIRFSGGEPKGLLRRLARRHIPARAVNRRKQGFSVPIGLWFRRDWTDLVNDLILGSHVERRGWFQRDALERIVAEHRQGRNRDALLWTLLILEIWLRLVVDKTVAMHDTF